MTPSMIGRFYVNLLGSLASMQRQQPDPLLKIAVHSGYKFYNVTNGLKSVLFFYSFIVFFLPLVIFQKSLYCRTHIKNHAI